jgi:hypothetical protein
LTKQQIEQSPPMDADKPVSRQFETQYHQYFDWPMYWQGSWLWGTLHTPDLPAYGPETSSPVPGEPAQEQDSHLRSTNEVRGYAIQARDHHFGHIEDFVLEEETWQIRYVVVDTRNWLPGKRVLLAPQWISRVSWPESKVDVDMDEETIKRAPEFDRTVPLTRDYEEKLFRHYQREPYWTHAVATTPAH